jgi:hypothetical protein
VILANKLEGIRSLIESRPTSGAFHKPVNRRALPRYYEVISDPIDLSGIRDKIKKYVSSMAFILLMKETSLASLTSFFVLGTNTGRPILF